MGASPSQCVTCASPNSAASLLKPSRRQVPVRHREEGLLADLLDRARALGCEALSLEVRVSNFAAQGLYRAHGFRLAGSRRGYYRDTGEDALVMEWRPPATGADRRDRP